jgi:SulP family sulfate permease
MTGNVMAAGDLTPKLVSVFRDERYDADRLRRDAVAGMTVAVVALPLSMAIAIASGLTPAQGLVTAIVGGFLISALGGSRFQIGGPAGAFIVLVYDVVQRQGVDGLILATAMAGLLMVALGLARLGSLIAYVPFPVVIGFTAGIGVIIFASQIKELLGLSLAAEPAALWPKLQAIAAALPSASLVAIAIATAALATVLLLRRYRPAWPALLIAVAGAGALTWACQFEVATIGSRFGALPSGLPRPVWPLTGSNQIWRVLPDALAIALLGSIESLLSAVVADGMTGRRHRPNIELIAQGAGNVGSALFGGMPVTGTIARTATNVRAGGTSPVAGMVHAVILLGFLLVAAPLAGPIPLAALAAVLTLIAWGMIDRHDIARLLALPGADRVVLVVTFLVTISVDLVVAIGLGTLLALLAAAGRGWPRASVTTTHDGTLRIAGPLTFLAVPTLLATPALSGGGQSASRVDLQAVTAVDASAAQALARLHAASPLLLVGAPAAVSNVLSVFKLPVAAAPGSRHP